MKIKYLLIVLIVLALAVFVFRSGVFSPTGNVVLDVPEDEKLGSSPTVSETADSVKNGLTGNTAANIPKEPIRISIMENGFFPAEINIAPGQQVIWKNERKRLKSLVMGVRELIDMRSEFLLPGEEFSWTFNEEGEFDYMDGVTIGREGKVIVERPWK